MILLQSKGCMALTRLATGETVRCRFANKVRDLSKRDEIISQFHPLIRFIGKQLREKQEAFHQLVSVKLSASEEVGISPGTYAFFVNRWEFSGIKVEEDLSVRAVKIESDSMLTQDESWLLLNKARVEGADWLEISSVLDVESFRDALDKCIGALGRRLRIRKGAAE